MGRYVFVCRPKGHGPSSALSAELAQLARTAGLSVSVLNPHAWLAVTGPAPPKALKAGAWTLIGDVFNRRSPRLSTTAPDDPFDFERKLVARFWGRFVGVRFGAGDQAEMLLRDPSGGRECIAWEQEGLTIVCSDVEDWLLRRLRPDWRIDTGRLRGALLDPVPGIGALLLTGPTALEPGTAQPLPLARPAERLWSPQTFARRSLAVAPSPEDAARGLREAIDEAVSGLLHVSTPIAAEVSGGLDSSLVASSLVRHKAARTALWMNAYGATPEADERTYVEALARRLHITPTSVPHAGGPLSLEWLEDLSHGFRPGLNALDRPHDLDWAARLQAAGLEAIMTGKGGDSILLQRATPEVFVDAWRRDGWRVVLSADARELAAANEVSVWTLLRIARAHDREGHPRPLRDHPMLEPLRSAAEPPLSPWMEGWQEFGPAKAMQIAALADGVARHGPSRLTETVDARHPLCSQPVIETCLALPAPLLVLGGRERGLARLAFHDRLPREIIERRSKGDMTRIYGRMILSGLDVLRPWLLDGRLAALGLIDRTIAERELTREGLVWRGRYSTLMVAAAFEGWVRRWEARLTRSTT